MLRSVVGVIAGYVTMFILVFGSFTAAYLIMGTDRAYQPGTFDVSMLWIIVSVVLGTIAAIVGGMVCVAIARRAGAGKALATLVLVLGVVLAIPAFMTGTDEATPARPANVSPMEAMQQSKQPAWVLLLNPVIGAVGVLIGAHCCRRSKQAGMAGAAIA